MENQSPRVLRQGQPGTKFSTPSSPSPLTADDRHTARAVTARHIGTFARRGRPINAGFGTVRSRRRAQHIERRHGKYAPSARGRHSARRARPRTHSRTQLPFAADGARPARPPIESRTIPVRCGGGPCHRAAQAPSLCADRFCSRCHPTLGSLSHADRDREDLPMPSTSRNATPARGSCTATVHLPTVAGAPPATSMPSRRPRELRFTRRRSIGHSDQHFRGTSTIRGAGCVAVPGASATRPTRPARAVVSARGIHKSV